MHMYSTFLLLTLGAHVRGLSVCMSVPALAASASVETSKQRYSRVSLRLFLDFDLWIFEKTFCSKVKVKSQYANDLELTVSHFRHFRDQRRAATTRKTTTWSNVASETSYWCNWHKTSEIGNCLPSIQAYSMIQHYAYCCRQMVASRACSKNSAEGFAL